MAGSMTQASAQVSSGPMQNRQVARLKAYQLHHTSVRCAGQAPVQHTHSPAFTQAAVVEGHPANMPKWCVADAGLVEVAVYGRRFSCHTFFAASLESCSDLAPVQTILPDAKISAVVLGSRMRMMTAAKRCTRQQ